MPSGERSGGMTCWERECQGQTRTGNDEREEIRAEKNTDKDTDTRTDKDRHGQTRTDTDGDGLES